MYYKWTKKEIDFLKENYPKYGKEYCSKELNINISKIKGKVQRLNLHLKDKTDINIFKNIKTKETAYIMGLLWSDGYINEKIYNVGIESKYDDMIKLEKIFMKTGNWKKFQRNRENCKPSILYYIGFKKLFNVFKEYDFDKKSKTSPNKVLKSIPEKFKKYFYRGLIDGDGCFYINYKHYSYQFTLASSHEQDWSYIINLFDILKIDRYTIRKQSGKSKSSVVRVTNKNDIFKIGNYIYKNFENDKIGLNRKYVKYKEIKNKIKKEVI